MWVTISEAAIFTFSYILGQSVIPSSFLSFVVLVVWSSMAATSRCLSSAMERTGQWVFSQEVDVPSDLVISVGEATFPLHKFIMMAKSGYVRNKILKSDRSDPARIDLTDLPGGAEVFENVVKFCYGINFEITVYNVAALCCATECLEMTERVCSGNLAERTEEFLGQAALQTLSGAVIVLRSCERLGRVAEETGLVQRCVDVISLKACKEANFPTRSPIDWWLSELISLPVAFLQRVVISMKNRGVSSKILSNMLITYAQKSLPDSLQPVNSTLPTSHLPPALQKHQVSLLESIISLLKSTAISCLPISFLCLLLRTAIFLNASTESKIELEKWIAADLDQASVGDFLAIALDCSGERVLDLDSVRRIVAGFLEKVEGGGLMYGSCGTICPAVVQTVMKTVDAFVGEIATDEELCVPKFTGLAGAMPKSARTTDDDVYRAVDIYLKAHPRLDEIEREKVCSVMDPLRLSYEARLHASQNKRLPIQVVLHALYYDQLKLRSGLTPEDPAPPLGASASARNRSSGSDTSLMRENAELRSQLTKMKLHLSDTEKNKKTGKKTTFFASVSKTLGKLNPFKLHESKDTSNIEDEVKVEATKPRRRRFSIS